MGVILLSQWPVCHCRRPWLYKQGSLPLKRTTYYKISTAVSITHRRIRSIAVAQRIASLRRTTVISMATLFNCTDTYRHKTIVDLRPQETTASSSILMTWLVSFVIGVVDVTRAMWCEERKRQVDFMNISSNRSM